MRFRPPFGKRSQTGGEDGLKEVKGKHQADGAGNGASARGQPRRAATNPAPQLHESDTARRPSKKRIMQDFFRNLRPSNSAAARPPAKAQYDRRSRVSKSHMSSSRRDSRLALPQDPSQSRSPMSFDISDDVLDRLMGPPKSVREAGGRDSIQSGQFLLKQRIKANSRKASATGTLASSGPSQAQKDRRVLSAEEVEQLLSGMPHFSIVRDKPSVTLKGDDEVLATDWRKLGHESFGLCTLDDRAPRSRGAGDGTQEVPNMSSANGLDLGTTGLEHFLQMPVADSDAPPEEQDHFDRRELLADEPDQVGLREVSVEALIDRLVELGDLRVSQHKDEEDGKVLLNEKRIEEMGEDLFRRLLDAELGISAAGTGSVTLRTQIEALQKVLNEEEVWYDFSQPVWRLRVGEFLWASQDEELLSSRYGRPRRRDLLLLQITLAAELLVRLDAFHDLIGHRGTSPADFADDREAMSVIPTLKVQWDLVLAQRFLDSLTISADVRDRTNKTTNRASLFSASSFVTAKTTAVGSESVVEPVFEPKAAEKQLDGLIHFAETICWPHAREVKGRLEKRLGVDKPLAEGDKRLQPPGKRASTMSVLSVYATAPNSPTFAPEMPDLPPQYGRAATDGVTASDAAIDQKPRKPPAKVVITSDHKVHLQAPGLPKDGAALQNMGWLSRSWLGGLVLPGHSAGHLLLSALLENSPDALQVLGDVAYLRDGFQYAGYMYWSKQNVLGRVLAPVMGARDCMGWVSMPIGEAAQGSKNKDGWIRLDVRDAPSRHVIRARIQNPQAVAKDSDPLCGLEVGKVQAGDLVYPIDGPPVMGNEVKLYGLSFRERSISGQRLSSTIDLTRQWMAAGLDAGLPEAIPPPAKTSPKRSIAKLTFGSPVNSKLAKLELLILYDVQFVTSYPCHPQSARSQPDSRPLSAAKDESQAASSVAGSEDPAPTDSVMASGTTQAKTPSTSRTLSLKDTEKELPLPPAHALHINYTFEVVPVAQLLTSYPDAKPRAVSRAEDRPKTAVAEEIVVLDCRGTEELEILARAWCAKVGENALIGRSGRTCLACCVREARALGVSVVIRT